MRWWDIGMTKCTGTELIFSSCSDHKWKSVQLESHVFCDHFHPSRWIDNITIKKCSQCFRIQMVFTDLRPFYYFALSSTILTNASWPCDSILEVVLFASCCSWDSVSVFRVSFTSVFDYQNFTSIYHAFCITSEHIFLRGFCCFRAAR